MGFLENLFEEEGTGDGLDCASVAARYAEIHRMSLRLVVLIRMKNFELQFKFSDFIPFYIFLLYYFRFFCTFLLFGSTNFAALTHRSHLFPFSVVGFAYVEG